LLSHSSGKYFGVYRGGDETTWNSGKYNFPQRLLGQSLQHVTFETVQLQGWKSFFQRLSGAVKGVVPKRRGKHQAAEDSDDDSPIQPAVVSKRRRVGVDGSDASSIASTVNAGDMRTFSAAGDLLATQQQDQQQHLHQQYQQYQQHQFEPVLGEQTLHWWVNQTSSMAAQIGGVVANVCQLSNQVCV
jgi:hypothetical protein